MDPPPSGWNGLVALFEGDPSAVPECPQGHPDVAYAGRGGLSPTPAVCGPCACSAPPTSCTSNNLDLYGDAQCQSTTATVVQPAPGQCLPVAPPGGTQAFSSAAPTLKAGVCMSQGTPKTLPPPAWLRAGLACTGGGLGPGCDAGKFCTTAPQAPFESGLCVWRNGDLACPAAFPDKHLFTDAGLVIDTRDCTACTCGDTTATCSVTTTVYTGDACTGASVDVPNDGSCTAANGSAASIRVVVSSSASCPAAGGQPIGSLTEASFVTSVCCAP